MLLIRNEQITVLKQYMVKQFEKRMILYLKEYHSEKCRKLADKKIQKTVRYGINRARRYGITVEKDMSRYINMMFVFGPDFDKDSNLPWVRQILDKKEYKNGSVKMDALYKEGNTYLSQDIES